MALHHEETAAKSESHCIAMGVGDLSFWCFGCDSYLNHLTIRRIFEVYSVAHIAKFGEEIPAQILKDTNFGDEDEEEMKGHSNDGNHHKNKNEKNGKNEKNSVIEDYLDHSIGDASHEKLMAEIESDNKWSIEWDDELNLPNIEPFIEAASQEAVCWAAVK